MLNGLSLHKSFYYLKKRSPLRKLSAMIAMGLMSGLYMPTAYGAETTFTYDEGLRGNVSNDDELVKKKSPSASVSKDDQGAINYNLPGGDYKFTDEDSGIAANLNGTVNITMDPGSTLYLKGVYDAAYPVPSGIALNAQTGTNVVINGNVNIEAKGEDYAAAGIRTDMGADDAGGKKTTLTINGDLTMGSEGVYGVKAARVDGGDFDDTIYKGVRWSPAGIHVNSSNGAEITVTGNTDLHVHGNAVVTDPYYAVEGGGDTATVNLKGETNIEVKQEADHGFLALGSFGGTINVNMKTKTTPGTNKVNIVGNILAMRNHESSGEPFFYQDGTINLGLTTDKSSWQGIIDNSGAEQAGTINLWLQNGATWEHSSISGGNALSSGTMPALSKSHYGTYDGISHVTKFVGSTGTNARGIIVQKDEAPIVMDNYSGNTKVIYEHTGDGESVDKYTAGDVKIKKAAANSTITLSTNDANINLSSTASVNNVLNALASKLWYLGYISNEKNLTGTVEIAEGLVSSSASLKSGKITFVQDTGRGSYVVPTKLDQKITGHPGADLAYADIYADGAYNFTDNTQIAGIQASDADIKITGDKHLTVDLSVASGNLRAIESTGNSDVDIKGSVTLKGVGGNSYVLYLSGTDADKKATINISGLTTASALGTGGSIGVYANGNGLVTLNGFSLGSKSGDDITWGTKAAGFGYYGSHGIYATSLFSMQKGAEIIVNGDTDIYSDGNGVSSNAGGSIASVGDGTGHVNITVNKENTRNYAALRAENGTVNVNMKDGIAKSGTVTINGNVSVTTGAVNKNEPCLTSIINLALNTADSKLNGVAFNAFGDDGVTSGDKLFTGAINFTLANGAQWVNEKYGPIETAFAGSHLAKLAGGSSGNEGIIYQNDENPLTIDNYSGSVKVFYEHNATKPTVISAGDVFIKKAALGSDITLITDNTGINTASVEPEDVKLVNNVLYALANKLTYNAYVDGERKLSGTVKIAEGLTTSSSTLKTGNISFYDKTGRGYYDFGDSTITAPITGKLDKDKAYADRGITTQDGIYDFTDGDVKIETAGALTPGGANLPANLNSAVVGNDVAIPTEINLHDNNLDISVTSAAHTTGFTAIGKGAKVEVNDPGAINVTAKSTGTGQTAALFTNGGGAIAIHNGGEDQEDKVLTIRGEGKAKANVALIKTMNGVADGRSNIVIDGLVDVLADGDITDGFGANEAVSNVASTISIGGGTIRAINGAQYAIRSYGEFVSSNKGMVYVNADHEGLDGEATGSGKNKVVIEGGIGMAGSMNVLGSINVGFGTADSKFTGDVISAGSWGVATGAGAVNLWFENGSTWDGNNVAKGNDTNVALNGATWTGYSSQKSETKTSGDKTQTVGYNLSMKNNSVWNNVGESFVNKFTGTGTNTLDMTDEKASDVTIDNYSGSLSVIYSHDASDPTVISAGDVFIKKAALGSDITLITDNTGIDTASTAPKDKETVNNVLNALANKLTYNAYVDGERNLYGRAQIAEGLTASSATIKRVPISFNDETGQGFYDTDNAKFITPITGYLAKDEAYADSGITTQDGKYDFIKPVEIETSGANIPGGPWYGNLNAGIIGNNTEKTTEINLNGNDLTVNTENAGTMVSLVAVGKGGKIEINDPGAITINSVSTGGYGDAMFVNGGGSIVIHNGGENQEDKVLTLRAGSPVKADSAIIKTMNGIADGRSNIIIDGLVDILADKAEDIDMRANEALSNVASTISIGGGTIRAINGAEYAIRSYGEFTSNNTGMVYVNADHEGLDGEATGSGKNKVVIEGGIGMAGSMNVLGSINVGFGTADSKFTGDVISSASWGVAKGAGAVNLWFENGSTWEGNNVAKGNDTNVVLNGATWTGYSSQKSDTKTSGDQTQTVGFNLSMKNNSVWNNKGESFVNNFTSAGTRTALDMTNEAAGDVTIDNYDGTLKVIYAHDAATPTNILGGDLIIKNAAAKSKITLLTDNTGINAASTYYADKNIVSAVLNALANKLTYSAFVGGENNLSGTVQINEGLTASSASISTGKISYNAETGKGFYDYTPLTPPTPFATPITGDAAKDREYIVENVTTGNGVYSFDKAASINTDGILIPGGPWYGTLNAGIIGNNTAKTTEIRLNGNDLTVNTENSGTMVSLVAVGKGGKIEIFDPGAITINSKSTGAYGDAMFVNGGGSIVIHNGGENQENKVLKLRAGSPVKADSAIIKTMNGLAGARSNIIIDGLVDILADKAEEIDMRANEALSNVASTISIGGGTIRAINGAEYAIRSYGEFVTDNKGMVYVNANHEGLDGEATGSGKNKVVIEGGIGMAGSMNVIGSINVGFGTADSKFTGDVISSSSWGAAKGAGAVNLWFENGSQWEGNNVAVGNDTNVFLNGATWTGYSSQKADTKTSGDKTQTVGFNLSMKNNSVWNNKGESFVNNYSGEGTNTLDMTDEAAGDVTIDNYSGSMTAVYAHEAANPTNISGGNLIIGKAAKNSAITLLTDNTGVADYNSAINGVLNALAQKLTYNAYVEGERNLEGKVKIGEGLTASSAIWQTGSIAFNETTGQGSLEEGSVTPGGAYELETQTQTGTNTYDTNTVVEVTEVYAPVGAVVSVAGDNQETVLDAGDNKLQFIAKDKTKTEKAYAIYADGADGKVEVKAKDIEIEAFGAEGSAAIKNEGGKIGLTDDKTENIKITGDIRNERGSLVIGSGKNKAINIVGDIFNEKGGNVVIGGENIVTVIEGNTENRGDMHIILAGEKSSYTGSIDPADLSLLNEAVWNDNVNKYSEIGKLTAKAGRINQTSNKAISIAELSGDVVVNYENKYDKAAGTLDIDANAGNFVIRGIDTTKNNVVTMNTSNDALPVTGLSDEAYAKTLNDLANKLTYTGAVNADGTVNKLEGYATINEGLTTPWAKAPILFRNGKNDKTVDFTVDNNPESFTGKENTIGEITRGGIEYGSYETTIMRGTRAAMASSIMAWRAEANDLMKRMGDLRLSPEESGAWAKIYRGRNSTKKSANYSINYTGVQVGYDKEVSPDWRAGFALSYMEGNSGYDMGGRGKNKDYNIGFYGTWTGKGGEYLDLIAKVGRLKNDFTVYSEDGRNKAFGDYGATGFNLSAEYGKKFKKETGFYFEPSAELNFSHVGGSDYTMNSDYSDGLGGYRTMRVQQSSFNSLIGRLAIGFGHETNQSTVFAKLSFNHEFNGKTHSFFEAQGIGKSVSERYSGSWLGLQIGGTAKLSNNCSIYGNIEKTFGGDIRTDFRADVGLRWSF